MMTLCDRYSPLVLGPLPVDCWLFLQRGFGVFDVVNLMLVHFVATRYGHRTKCQYLQVVWGYFAIYLVPENGAIRS